MNTPPIRKLCAWFCLLLAGGMPLGVVSAAEETTKAPPQDQGLPYTRSGRLAAVELIRSGIAVFPGSRYGYYHGRKVRLNESQLRHGEATLRAGVVFVPAGFAAVLKNPDLQTDHAPAYLTERWVYTLGLPAGPGEPVDLASAARAANFPVSQDASGLLVIGIPGFDFAKLTPSQRDCLVTLFDTPEKFADPDIATRSIPLLANQGKWTDHVKATPEQLAILNGPETEWKFTSPSAYDLRGFNAKLLGSKVPAPGVYPRVLFSPEDVPMLAERVKRTVAGQKSLIEMECLFARTWWDPQTSDGQIFRKLAAGDVGSLQWFGAEPWEITTFNTAHLFKDQKPGIYNSHVAYVPECLTAMALYCLITGDDAHGREAAAALANYYKLREPMVDEWLATSDTEFGSGKYNGNGANTHWRNLHGVVAHMNLGLSLDFAGKWMNADEKELMRRIIAKATYGRRSYGQDGPVRFRDVNWVGWDLTHYLAVLAIEGLEGFDAEAAESGAETVRAFCEWGIDDAGVVFESNGKTPGSFQFITLSMVAMARRGENLWGHPHWRQLLTGQTQMTSPSGRVTVNSGTQYVPYSRQSLSINLLGELKAFYPESRASDYLLSLATEAPGALQDNFTRAWDLKGFDPARYREEVKTIKNLRLPSLTYPGFVRGVLYDADFQTTTRAELNLPLDFNAPVQGVFSSYSDRTPNAAWINLMVRPNHYLGAGHHHADAGMFHFSALGVDWFTQSPFSQEFAGKYHNQVTVDGESEPFVLPGQILGYNAAAKYLGSASNAAGATASADLTASYSYRWLTQPPQVWGDELKNLGWEVEPSADILRIFAGTARYKMRPWWPTYTYSNYIPTSRAPFNPMRFVFRTTGLVRGKQPYGFVVDDLRKDDQPHRYQWAAMLNGGVWKAEMPGLPLNQMVLAFREPDPKANRAATKAAITPIPGEPLLLVCALGMEQPGAEPVMQVETLAGPIDKKGVPEYYDRLVINHRDAEARYRVLLVPFRQGEPVPSVSFDQTTGRAEVTSPTVQDQVEFTLGTDQRTRVVVRRKGEEIVRCVK